MSRPLPSLPVLSLLVLTACGDSLVGGSWLEELMGVEEVPAEVAWELRWFQGPGRPLGVECDLRSPWSGMRPIEEVYFGVAEVPPPGVEEIPEANAVIEGEGYTYGIALLVLFEPEPYFDSDPERVRTDLNEERGTWGVVEEYLVLAADGDLDALSRDVLVEPDEAQLVHGVQLAGFIPGVVLGTGSFAGAVYTLEEEESAHLWDVGLPAIHLEFMREELYEVFEGHALGGAERVGCHGEEG